MSIGIVIKKVSFNQDFSKQFRVEPGIIPDPTLLQVEKNQKL